MTPMIQVALILLGLTAVLALVGVMLVHKRSVRVKNATRYTQLSAALVLLATYLLSYSPWGLTQLRTLDFWSLMLAVAICAYALVWAALAYQLNKPQYQQEYGDSFMLSMLYTDSQHPDMQAPKDQKPGQH